MQSSKPDLWRFFRREPGRIDLSKQSSKLDLGDLFDQGVKE